MDSAPIEQVSHGYTPRSAGLAAEHVFGGMVTFGIFIFSLLVSGDCYFNEVTYQLSIGAVVASICVGIAWVWRANQFAFEEDESSVRAGAAHLVLLLYAPIIVYAALSLLVFLTSRTLTEVSTQIHASGSGRGCSMYYQFDNAPTGRTVRVCKGKFHFPVRSGDAVIVTEKIGPLGARILSFKRGPSP